jgi:hypothetical protein
MRYRRHAISGFKQKPEPAPPCPAIRRILHPASGAQKPDPHIKSHQRNQGDTDHGKFPHISEESDLIGANPTFLFCRKMRPKAAPGRRNDRTRHSFAMPPPRVPNGTPDSFLPVSFARFAQLKEAPSAPVPSPFASLFAPSRPCVNYFPSVMLANLRNTQKPNEIRPNPT